VSAKRKAAAPTEQSSNIQDISDALKALANLQELHEAGMEQVSGLEADLTEARSKIEDLEGELKDTRMEADGAKKSLDDAEDRIDDLEGQVEDLKASALQDEELRDLATARRLIKGGDVSGGVHELERVLDRSFDSWRIYA
jgi:TolA-binding protein